MNKRWRRWFETVPTGQARLCFLALLKVSTDLGLNKWAVQRVEGYSSLVCMSWIKTSGISLRECGRLVQLHSHHKWLPPQGVKTHLTTQEAIPVLWCWMRNVPHSLLYLKTELLVGAVGMLRKCLAVWASWAALWFMLYHIGWLFLYFIKGYLWSVPFTTFSIGAYFGFVWNFFVYISNYVLRVLCMLDSGI